MSIFTPDNIKAAIFIFVIYAVYRGPFSYFRAKFRPAREGDATPAQLTLAWLMAQGSDIIPIPSNKTRNHLEENVRATEIKLSKEDLARLDEILRPDAIAGPRSRDMHRVNI